MTDAEIERRVERRIDALDRRYLRGDLTNAAYRAEMDRIDDWATRQYERQGRHDPHRID